jgi:carbonic anhydrase
VEITTGLKAGEQVVITNVGQIVDGVRVASTSSSGS